MVCINYKKKVNGEIQTGYINLFTTACVPDAIRDILARGYTDIKIEVKGK